MQNIFDLRIAIILSALLGAAAPAAAQDEDDGQAGTVYPAAVFAFQERGRETRELGGQVTDLLFANLAADPRMYLVDREDLKKLIEEQELNLSGLVNPAEATRVGQLTGAKLLITGSVLQVNDKLYLIAKIIGTETSRVIGASAKGNARDELDALVEKLAKEVVQAVAKRSTELVAKPVTQADRVAAVKKALGKGKQPTLKIDISERHVGQVTVDPAAETEFTVLATECGFPVVDPEKGDSSDADILIIGEGFSEFATRHGNLISVKARLEVKAVDRITGKVLAADRQVSVEVDLTEQIAGKNALQEAAAEIAQRMLPKLGNKDNGKEGKKKEKNKKKEK